MIDRRPLSRFRAASRAAWLAAVLLAVTAIGGLGERAGVAQPDPDREPAASLDQQLSASCRALSFNQPSIQRWAFQKLVAAGPSSIPFAVSALKTANLTGQQLLFLLLEKFPSRQSAQAAMATLIDPDVPPVVAEAAIRTLATQAPHLLREVFAEILGNLEGDAFAYRQLCEALAHVPAGVALPILFSMPVPAIAPGEIPGAGGIAETSHLLMDAGAISRVIRRLLWQTACLRAAKRQPSIAVPFLDQAPAKLAPVVTLVKSAVAAFRRASPDLRMMRDRSYRVRQRGQRVMMKLFHDFPLLIFASLDDADFRVRTLALNEVRERGQIEAALFSLRALADSTQGASQLALDCLSDVGPLAPPVLLALADFCTQDQRTPLARLAAVVPNIERLQYLRAERIRLRQLLVPMMYQRTLHDPAAGAVFREWYAVQNEWRRLGDLWRQWWQENTTVFAPIPADPLVLELAATIRR